VLRRHIDDHRYYLGLQQGREIPLREAASSWYDQVYGVVVDELARRNAAVILPRHTPADLYVGVMDYLGREKEWQAGIDLRTVVAEYIAHYEDHAPSIMRDMLRYTRRFFSRLVPLAR
jgi:hypothetical protein